MTNSEPRGYHGIDIGGSKIELVAFADSAGGLAEVHRERIATPGTDFDAFVQELAALVQRGDAALGMRAPAGIGLPGILDSATGRQLSSNVPALNGRLVASALQDACSAPSPSATTASASPCPKPTAARRTAWPACSAPSSAPARAAAIAWKAACCAA